MKNYYFVGELETDKILGFNLTEEVKDKLFYHKETGGGHRSSEGRFYSATTFKVVNLEELHLLRSIRNHFKNTGDYSYIILTDTNEWVGGGFEETEYDLLKTIERAKSNFPNVDNFLIFETIGESLSV